MQEVYGASVSTIENGRAMIVMGGVHADHHPLSTTQIVSPNSPTRAGPQMREWTAMHCSVPLGDNKIMTTGGQRQSQRGGSDVAEILDLQTGQWEDRGRMRQQRALHTCATTWMKKDGLGGDIFNNGLVTNTSVLSVVVAGGK